MDNKEKDMKRPLDEEIIPEELEEKVSGGTGINGCYINMAFGINTPDFLNNAERLSCKQGCEGCPQFLKQK